MTDYAQTTAADPAWTWWMTTAAAAAVRMRNLRHDHLQQTTNTDGSCGSDADDEYAGPGVKRQRFGHAADEYWPVAFDHRAALQLPKHRQLQDADDAAAAGPLDLSVKATVVDGPRVSKTDTGGGCADDGYMTAAVTPEKRPVASACASRGGKSSKKTAGGTVAVTTAVKAATRKLLPQLMFDRHRVDRSSPVSGTIIVPATPLEVPTAGKRLSSSSSSSSPPPLPLSLSSPPYADGSDGQEEYDGGDIDPEFNVVVATDEARRQIDSIPNALGPYRCRLCGVRYADAFALARHRCRCIVHVRYTCPECDKVFQCPANLASHRRWHGTAGTAKTATVKPPGVNRCSNKNGGGGDNGDKPAVNAAPNNVNDMMAVNVNDGADGVGGTTAVPVITASGFKKNMLQRAVQAAAAAANNNNNNDDNKNKNNDIAK